MYLIQIHGKVKLYYTSVLVNSLLTLYKYLKYANLVLSNVVVDLSLTDLTFEYIVASFLPLFTYFTLCMLPSPNVTEILIATSSFLTCWLQVYIIFFYHIELLHNDHMFSVSLLYFFPKFLFCNFMIPF